MEASLHFESAMNILIWFTAAVLSVDVLLIGFILVQRVCAEPPIVSILDLGPFIISVGVLVAFLTFLFTLRRGRSDDLLNAATDLLEKAYQMLSPTNEEDQPKNDRRAWLSAARLIRAAEKLGARITEESHRLIYRENREYWRARFYDLIFPSIEGLPSTFYAERPEHMISHPLDVRAPLSEKSIAFLYRFVRWPKGLEDPIRDEPNFTEEEVERMCTFGPRGLGNLLVSVRQLRQKHES